MKFDLIDIFKLASLDEEEKLKRRILLRTILLTVCFGFLWALLYVILGFPVPALVPFVYGLLSIGNILHFYLYKRYNVFRTTQLILILLLPVCMQISLGTFTDASTVVLASVLCPMGALMFHTVRVARIFFYFFIGVVIIAGLYSALGPEPVHHMNPVISVIFFVSNIVVICTIIFVLVEYFVAKKNSIQNLLAQKNKDITDSITYAKRIQQAILPPDNLVKRLLPESFILYKPKDIVSGDFYWVAEWGEHILFAAVDCTGHGVPGAFMSIVGQNMLNQTVNEHGLYKPNLVLNSLNKAVARTLGRDANNRIKDGMDIALCSLDKKKMLLEFSGAFNPVWILRGEEIFEIKGNKFPIGSFLDNTVQNFDCHEFALQPGDRVYVFTDGYADQFGGPKGKKFKYKNIKKLLLESRNLSMPEQRAVLEKTLEDWKGKLEQIDDVLVMGVRV
ncbi:MAG: PP2C family protein-serine/threonine phosphatase [Bacteroidia bacterium]